MKNFKNGIIILLCEVAVLVFAALQIFGVITLDWSKIWAKVIAMLLVSGAYALIKVFTKKAA